MNNRLKALAIVLLILASGIAGIVIWYQVVVG